MRQPSQKEKADDEAERKQAGISPKDWDDAFAWADDDAGGEIAAKSCTFAVWRCNWEAVTMFTACETQWKRSPMGGFEGLNYPGVDVVLVRRKASDPDAVFVKVQSMELAALEVLNG
jgi:hypothetical protein